VTDDCGRDGPCTDDRQCFKHKIRSIQWSPSATPSRRNNIEPRRPNNSWEKGIATDNRGMPLLNPDGTHIGLQRLADKRPQIEDSLRRLKHEATTATRD
jgi:hypothetical protein